MRENIETIVIALVGVICISISILDFTGALESFAWISSRISIMTLLALGSVAIYLVIERHRAFAKLNESIKTLSNEMLSTVKPNELDRQMVEEIKRLWAEREGDIQRLFLEIETNKIIDNHATLIDFLHDTMNKFYNGDIFGRSQKIPWDFTIAAVSLHGDFIYHPSRINVGTKASLKYPYSQVVEQKNGELFWLNDGKSEQFRALVSITPARFMNSRFTKVYFHHIERLMAIVVFESHIDILHQIPKAGFREYGVYPNQTATPKDD